MEQDNPGTNPSTRATERQIWYAKSLGLTFPADISREDISKLISNAVNPPATPEMLAEAKRLGIGTDAARTNNLAEPTAERQVIERWVYSVLRRESQAKWMLFSECFVPPETIVQITADLAADRKAVASITKQEYGLRPWAFVEAAKRRGIEPDPWFFFGEDGANPKVIGYKRTVEAIAKRI